MTNRAARPLDYATLSEGERMTVEMLYYGERDLYERRDLLCSARELKRLVRQGWIESTPEQVDEPHYDRGATYHPAAYWITGRAWMPWYKRSSRRGSTSG